VTVFGYSNYALKRHRKQIQNRLISTWYPDERDTLTLSVRSFSFLQQVSAVLFRHHQTETQVRQSLKAQGLDLAYSMYQFL
jgi:hypothetical protein